MCNALHAEPVKTHNKTLYQPYNHLSYSFEKGHSNI